MTRKPRTPRKPRRTRAKRKVEPRTPAPLIALVGLLFGVVVAACLLGAYQLFRSADSHPPYRSVVLIPSHTPEPTPYPPGWRQVSAYSVPILMYHHIRPMPTDGDQVAEGLTVTPEAFGRQLDYLTANGFTPITFAQLRQGTLPSKPVILTFDDGPADSYSAAFPVLRERGLAGTFYIVSGFVGRPDYVTWDQLREMQRAGMEIGAHSVSHPDLATASEEERHRQVDGSIIAIQEALGRPVITFAYPAGKTSPEMVSLLEAAGVLYSVTTAPGTATNTDNPQLLPRHRITNATDLGGVLP